MFGGRLAMSRWAEFELVTTTPLAMGGGHNRGPIGVEPLRSRSLRGLLRVWTRFLLGARLHDDHLRDVERALYGGVHPTPQESAIRCRVTVGRRKPPTHAWGVPDQQAEGPHGERKDDEFRTSEGTQVKGVRYLGDLSFRRTNDKEARHLVAPGHHCTVGLRYVGGDNGHEDHEALMWASLWLLVHLGGAGSRNRRAFGSLRLDGPVPPQATSALPGLPWELGETPAACAASLLQGLQQVADLAGRLGGAPRRRPGFGTLDNCRVRVLDEEFGSPADAQRHLGNAMVAYRHHRSPDTETTLARTDGVLERPLWGLPLSMPGAHLNLRPDIGNSPGGNRWPSPLTFRVQRLAEERFALVVVGFDVDPPTVLASGPERTFAVEVDGISGAGAVPALLDRFAPLLGTLLGAWP